MAASSVASKNDDPVVDWRERANADAPAVVRAIVRAIKSGSVSDPAPGGLFARAIVESCTTSDEGTGAAAIGRMAGAVYREEFGADTSSTISADAMLYLDNLIPRTITEFLPSNAPRTLAQDIGETTEAEVPWLAAMAVLEVQLGRAATARGAAPVTAARQTTPAANEGEPRYVVYQYCISIVILTFKRSSGIKVLRPGQNPAMAGMTYTLISLFFGWWGIPWGPIYTIQTIFKNLSGGIDVTEMLKDPRTTHLQPTPTPPAGWQPWMDGSRKAGAAK